MKRIFLKTCFLSLFVILSSTAAGQYSLRFYGNGVNAPGLDRVKISIDNPHKAADVKGNFTIEFWIKCSFADNNGTVTAASNGDGWITGNIIYDRDIYGSGDYGDYGISLGSCSGCPSNTRVIAFGIDRQGNGATIIGATNVADGAWHHVAVTRRSNNGQLRIFIDGVLDAQGTGPVGDVSYRNNRPTSYPASDPFIVIGAEKHDAGAAYPSYNGFLDELRISKSIRYNGNFTVPSAPFTSDSKTAALYHFDEGSGTSVLDAAAGASHGTLHYGGSPAGPQWVADQPFALMRQSITAKHIHWNYTQGILTLVVPDGTYLLELFNLEGQLLVRTTVQSNVCQLPVRFASGPLLLRAYRRDQPVVTQRIIATE